MKSLLRLWWSKLKLLVGAVFLFIPLTFLPALVVWFFGAVVFQASITFLTAWRWVYILAFFYSVIWHIIVGCVSLPFRLKRLADQYQASFDDVVTSVIEYKMLKEKRYTDWTPEQFEMWFGLQEWTSKVQKGL